MPPARERPEVDRPLFIVGCGRSGTTLLYDMLAAHPDLAWFSNVTQRLPRHPELAFLSRAHRLRSVRTAGLRGVPRPGEGHAIWDAVTSRRPADNGPLGAHDATPEEVAAMRRVVAAHMRWQGRPRFVNKNTRNARRVGLLDAAFPDARFVHVVRDPRATVASLLRVAFWPDLPIWWADDRTPRELEASGWEPVRLGAEFWRREVLQASDDLARLEGFRSITVLYEDLVAHPTHEVVRVLDHAGLPADDAFMASLDERRPSSRNDKFRRDLASSQIEVIEQTTASAAMQFGYDLS